MRTQVIPKQTKSGDNLIMETMQSRSGGVYRDDRIKALYAPVEMAQADLGDAPMKESLAEIAEELSVGSLYAMQAITLIAAIISVIVLSSTGAWMAFAAAGFATVGTGIIASAGAYLIAVKSGRAGAH